MKATVVILTLDGEEFLDEVLAASLGQQAPFGFEVLVIDSGSRDRTLEIVASYPKVRLTQIPNRDFGHGRTRNLAARLASGEVVAYLTQDATPATPRWLAALVGTLDADPRLAGVYGKQVPRPHCCPPVKRDVTEFFDWLDTGDGGMHAPEPFFSNVNSAVRRAVLETIPFRDVGYAEDRAFASDVAAAGLSTAYCPGAVVWHSHDLRLRAYLQRMYDEARGLSASPGARTRRGVVWLAGATVRGTVKDWTFLGHDPAYRPVDKITWAARVPLYNAARRLAIWLSGFEHLPGGVEHALSLDARRRRAAGGA